ncbi:hypothetical protein [Cetobacterium sp.]|uniref:hypothetical protein n=1 Tax=Cetobacterium sp. TaxID=2071632 RepID=UPI003EE46D2A
MFKKYCFGIIFIIVFLLNLKETYSYINIYPTKFEKIIEKELTEEFFLYNRTKKTLKYRIYLEKNGEQNDMTPWIKIYPRSITLKPLEEKTIKIFISRPNGIKKGEYTSQLIIKEIENPKEKNNEKVQVMTILKMKMKGIIK